MGTAEIDAVLTSPPPMFSATEAAAIARDIFGVSGAATATDSERDQTFLIDGDHAAVLKISNAAEDPRQLDLEARAAQHIAAVDPALPVALPRPVPGTNAFRAQVVREGNVHWARLYDRLPGNASVEGASLSDEAIVAWGAMAARVGRALRGFFDPAAQRVMPWDVQHALQLRPLLETISDDNLRQLVSRALDRYEQEVTPLWPTLRHQVIHTDHCASNTLVDDEGEVTGIIDFGDASWSALVVDLAAVLETVVDGREEDVDEFFRVCRLALDGYDSVTPLEPNERRIVGELLAARMCAGIVIPSWRASLTRGQRQFPQLGAQAGKILRLFEELGWDEVRRRLGGHEPGSGESVPALVRRRSVLGPAMTAATYRTPLHIVRGQGVWLIDADGRRYLDAYNNVPVVGHEHPRVVEAIVGQARRLNTNTRYLHETVLEVADRLVASTGGALDTVMFVNSGSEANDVAWRIARAVTGGDGGITTDYAYHGITEAISALTPEDWRPGHEPAHVRTWRPTHALEDFPRAVAQLREAGHAPAAAIMDAVLTSDGIIDIGSDVAQQLVQQAHAAGALWIADEVQSGHGRTGAAMWGYQRLGIAPDIVTVGKPMGNGHPVAAVITRHELARAFSPEGEFFSTFGGNPVAMAAALAVLDVIEDQRVIENSRVIGAYLGDCLREMASTSSVVRAVRQIGLAVGVEVADRQQASDIVEAMRDNGVLIGTTGRTGNVLKIRPPLVFTRANADQLTETLAAVLGASAAA
jgi:4-aminobutyrate aminotransferase-like enzyme/Ser/Thr protein kinase RdoA (MazF antagonist)